MIIQPVQVTPPGGGDLNDGERRAILDAAAGLRPALTFCVVIEGLYLLSSFMPFGGVIGSMGILTTVLALVATGMLAFALVRIADGAERAGVRMLAVTAAGLIVASPLWSAIVRVMVVFHVYDLNNAFISTIVGLATFSGYGLLGYILGRMSKAIGQPEWPPMVLGALGCTGGLVLVFLVRLVAPTVIPYFVPAALHAGFFVCLLVGVINLGKP